MSWLWKVDPRGLVVPIILIVAAEVGARVTHLQSDSLAAPSQIVVAGIEAMGDGTLLRSTYETLACAGIGLSLGFGLGLVLGIFVGLFKPLDRLLEVTIETVRPIPSVALIPVALLVFGFGYKMEYATIAFATIWPTLILTRSAIAGVEPRLFEVARVLRLSLAAQIFKIVIPAAVPRIFVALRLSVGISLIVAVTVEISANTIGLGHTMMEAAQSLHPDLMLAFLIWVGVLGWGINFLMVIAQKRLFGPMMGEPAK
jgi:ABC-type nitrate/sulfonate/bicarbonate transport system permease component